MANIKKLAVLLLSVLMAFGISAIAAGCSDSDKLEELSQRIAALEEENKTLSEELQQRITDLEESNKTLTDKLQKLESLIIDGTFYTLQEAFEQEMISKNNLQSIANYYNNRITFPESLSKELEQKIQQAYVNILIEDYPEIDINDVYISAYYGTYNSCVVLEIASSCVISDPIYYPEYAIGEVVFYNYTPILKVWSIYKV